MPGLWRVVVLEIDSQASGDKWRAQEDGGVDYIGRSSQNRTQKSYAFTIM